jgi:hypothetical protein
MSGAVDALEAVMAMVAGGKIKPADAAVLFRTLAADLKQIGAGKDLTPDQIKALATANLPFIKLVAGELVPGGSIIVAVGALIVSASHPMQPGSIEEQRWFDRASGGPGAR